MLHPAFTRLIVPEYPVRVADIITAPEDPQDSNADAWGFDVTVP